VSRAGLLVQLGDGPPLAPEPLLAALRHRGALRAELGGPGLRAWVVAHDEQGDGWDLHEGAATAWTVVLHGRLRGPRPSTAAEIAALLAGDGPAALAGLRGPFAVVAVQPSSGTTVLARSTEGNRPLFVARSGDSLVVASEPAALLQAPGVGRAVDERAAATILSGYLEMGTATLWRDVRRVEAGTAEVHRGGRVEVVPLWPLLPLPPFRGGADELAGAYEALLRELVGAGIPAQGGVACDVSGGLDSSSVAIVLAQVLPDAGRRLTTITQVFDDVPAADERAYAEAVLARLPGRRIVERPVAPTPASLLAESRITAEPPSAANRTPATTLDRLAADGVTRLFTGQGGDDIFDGGSVVVDHLRRGRLGRALSTAADLAAWYERPKLRGTLRQLWWYGARPLLRPLVRGTGAGRRAAPLPYLSADWLDRIGWRPPDPSDEARLAARGSGPVLLDALATPYRTLTDEGCERDAALAGLEEVDPFNDLEVGELVLSLPPELLLQGGDGRWLQRTLPGLPPEVAARRTKAEFSVQLREAVDAYLADPDALVAAAASGWLADGDPEALRARVRSMPRADQAWQVVAVDVWLRTQGD
jgi:asparagine synthase (glutamine-hydrolysing)